MNENGGKWLSAARVKKAVATLLFALIAVASHLSWINRGIENSFFGEFDKVAEGYFDDSLKRAAYTFAAARGINGVISVIQNTSVSVSPAGVGVDLAAGQILDPVNDLVERFSWVMLVSATSLGIQKILLAMGKYFGFDVLLTISMAVLCIGVWTPKWKYLDLRMAGVKLAVVAFAIRFCVPAAGVAGDGVYKLFLKDTYERASHNLTSLGEDLAKAEVVPEATPEDAEDKGLIEDARKLYDEARRALSLRRKIEGMKQGIGEFVDHAVNLIVVFLLQTIVFPLIFLWILVRMTAYLAKKEFSGGS